MKPLRERVTGPEVRIPHDTAEVSWRTITEADFDALHELEREVSAADHPHYVVSREEIAEDFEMSFFDAATDSLLAQAADGTVLAYGIVFVPPGQETLVRSILPGAVRPDARGRGLGRQLFEWQVARGIQTLAASDKPLPGWLMTFVSDGVDDAARLFTRFGLTIRRYFLELRHDVQELPDAPLDDTVSLVPFSADHSEATRVARNDAFRDHWGSQPTDPEGWDAFVGRSIMRPDLSCLAIGTRDGVTEVAGMVLVSVNPEDWEGTGFSSAYIDLVGVRRQWRGRGLATAMLARSLRLIAADGLDKAVLDVDAESPTGALGLYTSLGFAEATRSMSWVREF
jgi:ribosomal protein S18 acetylase RimI-like enzyme